MRWEDQGARKKERDASKMTARVWTKAPISYFDHYFDDRRAAPVLDRHRRRRAHRDHAHVGLQPVASRTSTHISYDISPDGLEVAFVTDVDTTGVDSNLDIVLLASCGCKAAAQHHGRQQGRRRCAALQPGRPADRVHAAAHHAVLRGSRAADDFRPRRGHHGRNHGELGPVGVGPRLGTRLPQFVRHDRRRGHAAGLSLQGRRRAHGRDARIHVRRAGAVGEWQGPRGDSPELHRAAHAGVDRADAAAWRRSSRPSTTRRSRASRARKVESVTYTGAKQRATSRCGSSIHPASTPRRSTP